MRVYLLHDTHMITDSTRILLYLLWLKSIYINRRLYTFKINFFIKEISRSQMVGGYVRGVEDLNFVNLK
jgi:hypothetical protein